VRSDQPYEVWRHTIATGTNTKINTLIDGNIDSFWYDRTNGILYYAFRIETGAGAIVALYNINVTTEVDAVSFASAYVNCSFIDCFIIGATQYLFYNYTNAGNVFVEFATTATQWNNNMGASAGHTWDMSYIIIIGTLVYFLWNFSDENVEIWVWNSVTHAFTQLEDCGANTVLPTSKSMQGISYDGSDVLYFVLKYSDDNKNYLCSYSISTDTFTKINEYNIALMLDRNCVGTAPNEIEKAFDIAKDANNYSCIYELKENGKPGILQFQTILKNSNINAITDNYLIFADKTIWVQTNVFAESPRYVATTTVENGIYPCECSADLVIHPDYIIYFYEGDMIKIYDSSSVLGFKGFCFGPERDNKGVYYIECEAYKDELLFRAYSKAYSVANTTDEKQIDILDNNMEFCYQSSSITATATHYIYTLQGLACKIFDLARFLERQVTYTTPAGLTTTKAYNNLTDSGVNLTQADCNLLALSGESNDPVCYVQKKTGITYAEVFGGVNSLGEVYRRYPVTTSAEELIAYPRALIPWEDPNLMNDTEAAQLAQNRYNIFNPLVQFVCIGGISGKGFLQPGTTVTFEFTSADGALTISSFQALISEWKYDPINDIYYDMVLTDTIVLYDEWEDHLINSGDESLRASYYSGTTQSTGDGTVLTQIPVNELRATAITTGNLSTNKICRVEGGTYTGDGTGNGANWNAGNYKSITCSGRPKFVFIAINSSVQDAAIEDVIQLDYGVTDSSLAEGTNGIRYVWNFSCRITATGFDVADRGLDITPNKNGIVYRYIVFY